MSNSYYVENIERVTEQTIEEEIKDELRDIKETAIKTIEELEEGGVTNCNKTKEEAINQIEDDRQETLDYIASKKREMIFVLGENDEDGNPAVRGKLRKIDSDTNDTYENIKKIAPDTEAAIEIDIRQMIVGNGYSLEVVNDGNGNVNLNLGQVV